MCLNQNPEGRDAFDYHLERALSWFKEICPMATWSKVVFCEDQPPDPDALPKEIFFTLEDYCQRFCELLEEGHSWINLCISGVQDGVLIVNVEWPNYDNNCPREYVSVNLSGPRLNPDGSLAWELPGKFRTFE